jgi:hypothetical protein
VLKPVAKVSVLEVVEEEELGSIYEYCIGFGYRFQTDLSTEVAVVDTGTGTGTDDTDIDTDTDDYFEGWFFYPLSFSLCLCISCYH